MVLSYCGILRALPQIASAGYQSGAGHNSFHTHPPLPLEQALALPLDGGRDFDPALTDTLGIYYTCQLVKGKGQDER